MQTLTIPHWQSAIIPCAGPCLASCPSDQGQRAHPSQEAPMTMTNLDPVEARRMLSKRRCSDCWEVLQEQHDEHTRTSSVSCSTPARPCRGHVSAEYVESALAESRLKRAEAEGALGESGAVPWIPRPARRAEAAILAEPGY